jgi:hypothetical protein
MRILPYYGKSNYRAGKQLGYILVMWVNGMDELTQSYLDIIHWLWLMTRHAYIRQSPELPKLT